MITSKKGYAATSSTAAIGIIYCIACYTAVEAENKWGLDDALDVGMFME